MLNLVVSNKFKKDLELKRKQNKDLSKIKEVLEIIRQGKIIKKKYKDHQLKGDMKDYRELHVEPDWLLVYKVDGDTLFLIRTGSHSELF